VGEQGAGGVFRVKAHTLVFFLAPSATSLSGAHIAAALLFANRTAGGGPRARVAHLRADARLGAVDAPLTVCLGHAAHAIFVSVAGRAHKRKFVAGGVPHIFAGLSLGAPAAARLFPAAITVQIFSTIARMGEKAGVVGHSLRSQNAILVRLAPSAVGARIAVSAI